MIPLADGLISDDILTTHFLNPIHVTISLWFDGVLYPFNNNLSHHHATFPEQHSQTAGIDACDGWHIFSLEPCIERFFGIPVRIGLTIISHNQCCGVNAFALHQLWQSILRSLSRGHTIITYQRVGHYQHLPGITGVSQTLWIASHSCIKHHLARYVLLCAKSPATELRTIIEDEFCSCLHFIIASLILVLYSSQTPGSPCGYLQEWDNAL